MKRSHGAAVAVPGSSKVTRRLIILGAAGGVSALAACGGEAPAAPAAPTKAPAAAPTTAPAAQPTAASAPAPAAAKAPAKIRVIERTPSEEEAIGKLIPMFMQQNPQISVDVELVPSAELIPKLQTMAASDTLPDNGHSYLGNQSYHNFSITGAFVNIESYVARDKLDLKQWFPALVDLMRIDGKLHGLPYKGQVLAAGFYYNVDLFEKNGVPLPTDSWTTDDLVKAAQRLTVRQGNETVQYGYAIQTWGGENLTAHLRAFNADSYSNEGKKGALDTPAALEAFQWYENLFQRERVMAPIADAPNLMVDGKVAMMGRAYFNFKTDPLLAKVGDKFKWDGGMMPKYAKTGKRGGMFAGDANSVTRNSKAPDAAWELLKFMTSKEFGVTLALQSKGSTTPGGRPDVYADERILNHPRLSKQTQRAQLNSVTEINEPASLPYNFRAPEIEAMRDPEILKITTGEVKAEPGFLKDLNSRIQAILDKPRP
ncbi:MAG: ABC transporter substrate-binding protein [Chloroflexota bacterium]